MPSNKFVEMAQQITLSIIPRGEYAVFLFGSLARGRMSARPDLDIGFWGNQPLGKWRYPLIRAFEESGIPYSVDLVDFFEADERFRLEALSGAKIWNLPENLGLNLRV